MRAWFRRIWYRLKFSNFLFSVRLNPLTWSVVPRWRKVPKYADDWFVDPYSLEYRFSFLMLIVNVIVETGEPYDTEFDL